MSTTRKLLELGGTQANDVNDCMVSEGALYGRSLVTDHGYTWEAPLKKP
jgi:hypothetical protein